MKRIGRRTFLRGAGTVMALPLLDQMAWAAPKPPKRLAFLFIPNGVNIVDWTPNKTGADFTLPYVLEPLAPFRKDLLVISGLTHRNARALGDGPGDHARSAACFLTGAHPVKTAGADIRNGVSVDQVAAQHVGRRTRFASLELGCEPGLQAGNCDSGYSCAYSSNISWRTPHTPMAKEINPRHVFERLFNLGASGETAQARARRLAARKSILDYVSEDAARLRKRLGGTDRRKLGEYLDGVREIERRIEVVEGEDRTAVAGMERPAGMPTVYSEHVRLMADVMVLAFKLDLTRVGTFMLANEGSNRSFPELKIPDGHHYLSHHGGDRGKIEKIRQINRFQSEQLAYVLKRLKETREGEGTLLDSTMLVYGSAISDGNRHNHDDLPILVAGQGGGTIRTGRHVQLRGETPLCNLYVSLLERMDVKVQTFGDSTGKLTVLA